MDKPRIIEGREAGYGRMDVRMVANGNSSSPDPAMETSWPPLQRLQWQAGTVHARTGLDVTVGPGEVYHNGDLIPNLFAIHVRDAAGHTLLSTTGAPLAEVSVYLSGLGSGIECERAREERVRAQSSCCDCRCVGCQGCIGYI